MSSEILVAILGFLGTLFGSGMGAFTASRLTNYRLGQLEKKIDVLSDKSERIALLEQRSEDYDKRLNKLEAKEA